MQLHSLATSISCVKMGDPSSQQQGLGRISAIFLQTRGRLKWAAYLCSTVFVLQYLMQSAEAEPVLGTSLFRQCRPVALQKNKTEDCCLPEPEREPILFKFEERKKMLVRRPAHELANDVEYVNKYNLAYKRMKELPRDDPRGFLRQWHVHCAFCVEAFLSRYLNGTPTPYPLQLHYSWTFLPWHRMMLYYHERILGSLINDPEFTLPFWNWDNQLDAGAAQMPQIFVPYNPPNPAIENFYLYEGAIRDQNHYPPRVMTLNFKPLEDKAGIIPTPEETRDANLCMVWNMVVNKVSAQEYLGVKYNTSADFSAVSHPNASAESGGSESLHNTAHEWVGNLNNPAFPDNEDMGVFTYSGRDPLFYSHHGNVDRLWDVWQTLPDGVTVDGTRTRKEFDDVDFLETEFTFFDENKDMVRVKVKDTLSNAKLGIMYQDMSEADSLWINHKPRASKPSFRATQLSSTPDDYPEVVANANNTIGNSPVCFKLHRRAPTKADLKGTQVKHIGELSEGVVMEKVKIPEMMYVRFDVYVDFPSANLDSDMDQSDYVGTFTHLPSGVASMESVTSQISVANEDLYRELNVRFTTGLALRRLGIDDYSTDITVTIVPRFRDNDANKTITFSNLKQEFL
ncbi:polyphenol oxidase [Marchantia polymorpha subsp. ruderalis]